MRKICLLPVLAILTFTACGGGSHIDTAAIERSVKQVLIEQATAWNNGDIEGYMAGYYRSEELTFMSDGMVTQGWESTLTRYKSKYTPEMMGRLTFSELEIFPTSSESAYMLGTWSLEREPDNPGGRFTLVFRKLEDGWKIVHDHTSSK